MNKTFKFTSFGIIAIGIIMTFYDINKANFQDQQLENFMKKENEREKKEIKNFKIALPFIKSDEKLVSELAKQLNFKAPIFHSKFEEFTSLINLIFTKSNDSIELIKPNSLLGKIKKSKSIIVKIENGSFGYIDLISQLKPNGYHFNSKNKSSEISIEPLNDEETNSEAQVVYHPNISEYKNGPVEYVIFAVLAEKKNPQIINNDQFDSGLAVYDIYICDSKTKKTVYQTNIYAENSSQIQSFGEFEDYKLEQDLERSIQKELLKFTTAEFY